MRQVVQHGYQYGTNTSSKDWCAVAPRRGCRARNVCRTDPCQTAAKTRWAKQGPRGHTIAVTAPRLHPGVLSCSRPLPRTRCAETRRNGCEPGPYGVLVTGTSTAQGCCWLRCGSKPLASAAGGPDSCDLPGLAASCRSDRARVPACLAILPNIPGLRLVGASDDAHGPGLGLARRVVAGR